MIAIKTQVNGRDVPLTELGSAVEQAIYSDVAEAIRERLKNTKCPEHGSLLEAVVLKKNADRPVVVDLVGCCQLFVTICEKKLD